MAKADAEDGDAVKELRYGFNNAGILGGVAGTVREHHTVGRESQNLLCRRVRRDGYDLTAAAAQGADDVRLSAKVHEYDAKFLFALGRVGDDLGRGDGAHGVADGIAADKIEVIGNGRAQKGVRDAVLADYPCYLAGVHAADAGDVVRLEKSVQIVFTAEVGGRSAVLTHDIAAHMAFALKVRGDDAVVADEREGLHYDLTVVAGVGQAFHTAGDAGGEDQLAHGGAGGAKALALQDLTVF